MAATATASPGPRYAPDDPTLPKPWRGLVDGKTGYLYFWNPETNVTQYEKPVAPSSNSSRPSLGYMSSSVYVQQSSRRDVSYNNDDDDKSGRGISGDKSQQHVKGVNTLIEAVSAGSTRDHGIADSGCGLSAENYRRRHEVSVTGGSVPPPFTTFEATGFPSEILKEMRYLLQGGANVVRCAALCWRAI